MSTRRRASGEARPARVLFVHHNPDLYGASRSLLRLARQLDRRRFEPLVVLPQDGPLRALLEQERVSVTLERRLSIVTRPALRSWRLVPFLLGIPLSVLALWRLIRLERVVLVHTNTGVLVSSALAAWMAGVPNVWHIRDSFQEFRFLWPFYCRYITGMSKAVIAVSEAVARQFSRRTKVVVIHNGILAEEWGSFSQGEVERFRIRHGLKGRPVVGCVGRIKLQRKGQECLVRAAALVKRRGILAHYVVVGAPYPGNERHLHHLKALIASLDLEEDVFLVGELEDPRPAYGAMSVFVLPSGQLEPLAGVVLEAMASGLPVVATRLGGATEQVVEGETGYLVPPADEDAMADRISAVLQNPDLRARLGREGARRARRHFCVRDSVARVERVFDRALGRAP